MINFPPKKLLLTIFVGGWLAASGWGIWRLAAYSLAPGEQGVAPEQWPVDSAVTRNRSGYTVVIVLHPECPCSEATVEELDSIIAHSGGRLRAHLLFVELPGLPSAQLSKLWERASRIPAVQLTKDVGGAEARRFGTRTSGETRLYGPAGKLLFHGGITASRGHSGDNPGEAAILVLLTPGSQLTTPVAAPVFGCALWNDAPLRKS
jgi:hypothetical protein